MNAVPDYESLSASVVAAGGYLSAAELQGLTCGHLAAGIRFTTEDYAEAVAEWLGQPPGELITGFCAATLAQLESDDLEFRLLLPDDDDPLAHRVAELGAFCRGFLSGFGLSGRYAGEEIGEELAEVLGDFAEIARASEPVDDSDENESDLSVIEEHVRVGVMIAFGESGTAQAH